MGCRPATIGDKTTTPQNCQASLVMITLSLQQFSAESLQTATDGYRITTHPQPVTDLRSAQKITRGIFFHEIVAGNVIHRRQQIVFDPFVIQQSRWRCLRLFLTQPPPQRAQVAGAQGGIMLIGLWRHWQRSLFARDQLCHNLLVYVQEVGNLVDGICSRARKDVGIHDRTPWTTVG